MPTIGKKWSFEETFLSRVLFTANFFNQVENEENRIYAVRKRSSSLLTQLDSKVKLEECYLVRF